ncbi:hypothetical protein DY000_02046079 [Brassica cretica]|uniref:Uncharacterized protein n=1 Tax=Brassica cretica TaxID=69181 RepID=A0ABQ7F1Y0_BRACR|nr:hypothetical protein DY000_02046079 [Brassica cretica]
MENEMIKTQALIIGAGPADLFNENGMPKGELPDHWKGKNGLYSVGFGRQGLAGITRDAQNVATDIASL